MLLTHQDVPVRNVRLYGKLGARFGRLHRLAVSSTEEAMRALCILHHGFEAYMMSARDKGMVFAVYLGRRNIGTNELDLPAGDADIRVAPIMVGAKNILGAIMVVVGVALVAFGMFTGQMWAVGLGIGMLVGGVAALLMPMPKDDQSKDKKDDEASYAFNGPVNTQAQGNPVPLLYGGPMVIGSAVASAGISSSDSVYIPVGGGITTPSGVYLFDIAGADSQSAIGNPAKQYHLSCLATDTVHITVEGIAQGRTYDAWQKDNGSPIGNWMVRFGVVPDGGTQQIYFDSTHLSPAIARSKLEPVTITGKTGYTIYIKDSNAADNAGGLSFRVQVRPAGSGVSGGAGSGTNPGSGWYNDTAGPIP